jgi:hypothetical protein
MTAERRGRLGRARSSLRRDDRHDPRSALGRCSPRRIEDRIRPTAAAWLDDVASRTGRPWCRKLARAGEVFVALLAVAIAGFVTAATLASTRRSPQTPVCSETCAPSPTTAPPRATMTQRPVARNRSEPAASVIANQARAGRTGLDDRAWSGTLLSRGPLDPDPWVRGWAIFSPGAPHPRCVVMANASGANGSFIRSIGPGSNTTGFGIADGPDLLPRTTNAA